MSTHISKHGVWILFIVPFIFKRAGQYRIKSSCHYLFVTALRRGQQSCRATSCVFHFFMRRLGKLKREPPSNTRLINASRQFKIEKDRCSG
jgi:hypothetical protein